MWALTSLRVEMFTWRRGKNGNRQISWRFKVVPLVKTQQGWGGEKLSVCDSVWMCVYSDSLLEGGAERGGGDWSALCSWQGCTECIHTAFDILCPAVAQSVGAWTGSCRVKVPDPTRPKIWSVDCYLERSQYLEQGTGDPPFPPHSHCCPGAV